jgi:hypothetical protein
MDQSFDHKVRTTLSSHKSKSHIIVMCLPFMIASQNDALRFETEKTQKHVCVAEFWRITCHA